MIFESLALPGAVLLRGEPVLDERGHFVRTYCASEFMRAGLVSDFPQHSISHNIQRGTLRGLHYQSGRWAETKIVRCICGRIFDVIVDLRPDSSCFGRWLGVELSAENSLALYIPHGFAHGFITLEDSTDVLYQITPAHEPGHGRSLRWDDPDIGIEWPLQPVILSGQDRQAPLFRDSFSSP